MNEPTGARAASPWEFALGAGNAADAYPAPAPEDLSARLLAYLRKALADDRLDYAEPPSRMRGGSQARIYRFGLSGASPDLARTALILRLHPRSYGANRIVKEGLVQNGLARQSYPAPRVRAACADRSVLGGVFLVMEFRPGDLMLSAPPETVPGTLGETHAALHRINPRPILESLRAGGRRASEYRFERELALLRERTGRHPRLRPVVDWLSANRPPEPEPPSICHGDFHPLNVLVRNGEVTGVLDWSDAIAGDPALDVACTMLLMRVFGRRVLSPPEADRAAEEYLEAYRAPRPFDPGLLDYYRIRRCLIGLMDGADGQAAWRRPSIARELAADVLRVTGLDLADGVDRNGAPPSSSRRNPETSA